MKTQAALQRTLQALLITGISIFALAPAHAEDLVKVTADNYVRAETDFQMKGYVETMDCLGQMVWESQRAGRPPDGAAYIDCVQRQATRD